MYLNALFLFELLQDFQGTTLNYRRFRIIEGLNYRESTVT
jgi:hypothetical protein